MDILRKTTQELQKKSEDDRVTFETTVAAAKDDWFLLRRELWTGVVDFEKVLPN